MKHISGYVVIAALGLSSLLLPVQAAEAPGDFASRIDLSFAPGAPFYRAELPLAVHLGVTRQDLADLRVFNAAGELVPFAFATGGVSAAVATAESALALFPLRAQKAESQLGGLDLRIEQKADGTVISVSTGKKGEAQSVLLGYLFDAGPERRELVRLMLDWPVADAGVNTRINLEASDDLKSWRSAVNGAPLLDLSFAGQRLKQQSIELNRLTQRYLRLSFTGAAVELSSAKAVLTTEPSELVRRAVTLSGKAVDGKPLEFQFDAGASLSFDRVAFALPQVNTVAPAQLLVRDRDGESWRSVATTVLYRLAGPGGEVTSPDLAISPGAARFWLLRLNPASGGLGSGVPQMRASYLPRHVVFAARGAPPFSLAYGRQSRAGEKDAPPSALQLTSLIPGFKPGAEWQLPEARPGVPVVVNAAASVPTMASSVDTRKLGLWAVLLVAVLLLGGMAWRLVKQMNKGS